MKIFKDGIDCPSAHPCTLYKALWHPESTIYIHTSPDAHQLWLFYNWWKIHWPWSRERIIFSLILFKTLDSQTFSQGAASLRSVTVFIGKWRKLGPIKKAIGKSRKLTKMWKLFDCLYRLWEKRRHIVINFESISREGIRSGKGTANIWNLAGS